MGRDGRLNIELAYFLTLGLLIGAFLDFSLPPFGSRGPRTCLSSCNLPLSSIAWFFFWKKVQAGHFSREISFVRWQFQLDHLLISVVFFLDRRVNSSFHFCWGSSSSEIIKNAEPACRQEGSDHNRELSLGRSLSTNVDKEMVCLFQGHSGKGHS